MGRDVGAGHRVPVHGGIVSGRHVEGSADVIGQDPPEGTGGGKELDGKGAADLGENPILAVSHRNHLAGIIRGMVKGGPAGFWIRAVALVIDFVLFSLVQTSLTGLARLVGGPDAEESLSVAPVVGFFTLLFAALYTSALHTMCGQTIGKMLVRVRVVEVDGELPPFGAALLRFIAYFASLAPFTAGYLMAGLRRDKRALHDLIAGTRVERVERPAPAAPPVEPPAEPVSAAAEPPSSGYL